MKTIEGASNDVERKSDLRLLRDGLKKKQKQPAEFQFKTLRFRDLNV